MTNGAERFGILALSQRRSKSRLSPGKIDTSILKRKTFEMLLRRAKTLSARFGQRSTIGLTSSWFDCVYGKRRITGLRCAECSAMVGTDRRAVPSIVIAARLAVAPTRL